MEELGQARLHKGAGPGASMLWAAWPLCMQGEGSRQPGQLSLNTCDSNNPILPISPLIMKTLCLGF